jgi:hypothetical protein
MDVQDMDADADMGTGIDIQSSDAGYRISVNIMSDSAVFSPIWEVQVSAVVGKVTVTPLQSSITSYFLE